MTSFIFLLFQFSFLFYSLNAQETARLLPSSQLVATLHGNAAFTCFCGRSGFVVTHVEWFANGSALVALDRKVEIQFTQERGIGQLTLTNLSVEFNMTRIRCSTVFESGSNLTSTDSLLYIQVLDSNAESMEEVMVIPTDGAPIPTVVSAAEDVASSSVMMVMIFTLMALFEYVMELFDKVDLNDCTDISDNRSQKKGGRVQLVQSFIRGCYFLGKHKHCPYCLC